MWGSLELGASFAVFEKQPSSTCAVLLVVLMSIPAPVEAGWFRGLCSVLAASSRWARERRPLRSPGAGAGGCGECSSSSCEHCPGWMPLPALLCSAPCPAGGRPYSSSKDCTAPPGCIVQNVVSHQTTHSPPHFCFMAVGATFQTKLAFTFRAYSCHRAVGW